MVNNKEAFSKWLHKNTAKNLDKKDVLKDLETLSILTGIKIYDLNSFNDEFLDTIIKEAKKFIGKELIEKFKTSLTLYKKMNEQKTN